MYLGKMATRNTHGVAKGELHCQCFSVGTHRHHREGSPSREECPEQHGNLVGVVLRTLVPPVVVCQSSVSLHTSKYSPEGQHCPSPRATGRRSEIQDLDWALRPPYREPPTSLVTYMNLSFLNWKIKKIGSSVRSNFSSYSH